MGGWAGVDAGVHSSELVVVDALGRVQVRQRFAMDGIGHLEALKTLRACSGRRRASLPVAIEDPASPLATALLSAGFPVLAVHGVTLARFRLGQAPARTKSDHGDATALANIIRVQPGKHRPVPADSPELLALRALTRAYEQRRRQQAIFERQMWSHLNDYYAAALPCLSQRTGRDMHAALGLAPTPAAARRLRPRRLASALTAAGRNRLNLQAAAEIIEELRVPHPRLPSAAEAAHGMALIEQLAMIEACERSVASLETASMAAACAHPLWPIFDSFPALGRITGARILGEIGDDPNRFDTARGLLNLAGVAPVTRASGDTSAVTRRHVYNRPLKRSVDAWVLPLLSTSPAARGIYDHYRQTGNRHPTAARKLLNVYLRGLHHCMTTGSLYDEGRMLRRPPDAPGPAVA